MLSCGLVVPISERVSEFGSHFQVDGRRFGMMQNHQYEHAQLDALLDCRDEELKIAVRSALHGFMLIKIAKDAKRLEIKSERLIPIYPAYRLVEKINN